MLLEEVFHLSSDVCYFFSSYQELWGCVRWSAIGCGCHGFQSDENCTKRYCKVVHCVSPTFLVKFYLVRCIYHLKISDYFRQT